MQDRSDERLMQRYAEGDMAAFEELYARYRAPLYRFILRQVNDEAQANDLYQGVWEKMIGAKDRYRTDRPFRAWAFRIARNHLVDFYRSHKPTSSLEQAGFMGIADQHAERLDQDRQKASLQQAIQTLPEEQREAIMLRLEGELSLDEIAQLTDVGRETVKSRLRYATSKLKQVLNQ